MRKSSNQERTDITRRQALTAIATTPIVTAAAQSARAAETPPNIVYIMADDLGYADLSCYGRRDFQTPNIDRLAAQGMRFTQAYANSAVCSATRTALITGRYQYRLRVGLEEPIRGNNGLSPTIPTLPSLLKKVGYGTTLIGKWHLGPLPDHGPLQSGYDHFWGFRGGSVDYYTYKPGPGAMPDLWDGDMPINEHGYLTDLLGNHAISSINSYAKSRTPFFISLHFNAPHWPWESPDDEAGSRQRYDAKGIASYEEGTQKIYASMVTRMDATVGRVLKALETNGVAGNTIVIFTSDNGGERFSDTWPFTGKKTELLEGGIRIPAIIRWPGRVRPRTTTAQVGISMDWLPTLLAAAGGKSDPGYPPDGVNLLPQLTQNTAPVPRKLYWRFRSRGQRAMRDGDLKYLKIEDNTYLFNVVDDPLERANLKNMQGAAFHRMEADYEAWNATMLPLDASLNSDEYTAAQLADHFPASSTAPQGGVAGKNKGKGKKQ